MLQALYKEVDACQACLLGATHTVRPRPRPTGDPDSKIMLVGEAPGLQEEKYSKVFIGPAGRKLAEMLGAIHWDINEDVYICNIVKCRPRAPEGSGSQNVIPPVQSRRTCVNLFLKREIQIVKPRIIVGIGGPATIILLDLKAATPMRTLIGRHNTPTWISELYQGVEFIYSLYHPAAFLHQHDPATLRELRRTQWSHLQTLKNLSLSS